jgi:hypothetical protein
MQDPLNIDFSTAYIINLFYLSTADSETNHLFPLHFPLFVTDLSKKNIFYLLTNNLIILPKQNVFSTSTLQSNLAYYSYNANTQEYTKLTTPDGLTQ